MEKYRNHCKKLFYLRWDVTEARVRVLSLGVIEGRLEQKKKKNKFKDPKKDSVWSKMEGGKTFPNSMLLVQSRAEPAFLLN